MGSSGGDLAVLFSVQADFEEVPFAFMSEGGKNGSSLHFLYTSPWL